MSNFDEEYQRHHADVYHQTVKRLQDENAELEERKAQWKQATGPKPPLDAFMGGTLKSEQEISALAAKIADGSMKEQASLERQDLIERPRADFDDKLRKKIGSDEVERIREEERQSQMHQRQNQQNLKP